MDNRFVRWWVVFCTLVCLSVIALISGGGSYIYQNDATFISWIVMVIFLVGSVNLGYHARECSDNFESTEFFVQACSGLGMLGTIVGLMIAMGGTFETIDTSDPESIKAALTTMASGTGAALTTTMVGLISALMLESQLIAVRAKWRAKGVQ